MKRITLAVLALSLLASIALVSCKKEAPQPAEQQKEPAAEQQKEAPAEAPAK